MGTKQHKQYIAEWKSINEDVKILSDYIAAAIWEDSQNLKPYLDKKNLKPFIKGNIIVDVNSCIKDDKKNYEHIQTNSSEIYGEANNTFDDFVKIFKEKK